MSVKVTDGTQKAKVSLIGVDANGVSTGVITTAACTIDREDVAEIVASPDQPGVFFISRKPDGPADADPIVTVTLTDTVTGISASNQIDFTPGAPTSAAVQVDVVSNEPVPTA